MDGRDVYLVGGLRSHLGLVNGIFKEIPPEKLGAALLRQLCVRVPRAREAQLVIGGNAVGSGGNLTRLLALEAGFPVETPALTVDMQCASALAALALGYGQIRSGLLDVVLAGGVESSSMQPRRVYQPWDVRYTPEGFMTAQFSPDTNSPRAMLEGAERTAQVYRVPREELDRWAVRSHQKAAEARQSGALEPYVVSLFGSTRDESLRPRMNEKLARRMPTLFRKEEVAELLTQAEREKAGDGTPTLTAANACLTQDGAAFLLLCSGRQLEAWEREGKPVRPLARIRHVTTAGVEPRFSPLGALEVGEKALQEAGLTYSDVDDFEYNEAFAVISALFARRHPDCVDRYLPLGGALAYGHPYGCSGAVLVLHALAALQQRGGQRALCAIAGAGGTGAAVVMERV
ncbi:thiolase family protein [Acidaminococcus timonensis]|uniref:thiolase family protein n=1 Tax=Acidaminococcus timonensis TaxID=1871002 RepID=UPI0025CF90D9|nr:thiolase family protein [Acidaminococcus timonensis]